MARLPRSKRARGACKDYGSSSRVRVWHNAAIGERLVGVDFGRSPVANE
jgi:hypothetical protein